MLRDFSAPPGRVAATTPNSARACGAAPTTASPGAWTGSTRCLKASPRTPPAPPAPPAAAAPDAAPAAPADSAAAPAPADSAAAPADVYALLVPIANGLADLLPQVRQIALAAHAEAPSEGTDIPASAGGYLNDVHRELSRAGNDLAAAAEAVAMVRLGAGDVAAVERRSALVHAHVVRARDLLTRK